MKRNTLLIVIFLALIACESDDEILNNKFENSKPSNLKRDFPDSFYKINENNELKNRVIVDSIPDIDIIHWYY